jgi:hypothetical protein
VGRYFKGVWGNTHEYDKHEALEILQPWFSVIPSFEQQLIGSVTSQPTMNCGL